MHYFQNHNSLQQHHAGSNIVTPPKIEQSPRRVENFAQHQHYEQEPTTTMEGTNTNDASTIIVRRSAKSLKLQERVHRQVMPRISRMLEMTNYQDDADVDTVKTLSWSELEDDLLEVAVQEMCAFHHNPSCWMEISEEYFLGVRSPFECQDRWDTHVSPVNFHLVMVRGKPEMRRFPAVKIDIGHVESSSGASGDDGYLCFDLLFWNSK